MEPSPTRSISDWGRKVRLVDKGLEHKLRTGGVEHGHGDADLQNPVFGERELVRVFARVRGQQDFGVEVPENGENRAT